jgi:hypothetical protein
VAKQIDTSLPSPSSCVFNSHIRPLNPSLSKNDSTASIINVPWEVHSLFSAILGVGRPFLIKLDSSSRETTIKPMAPISPRALLPPGRKFMDGSILCCEGTKCGYGE